MYKYSVLPISKYNFHAYDYKNLSDIARNILSDDYQPTSFQLSLLSNIENRYLTDHFLNIFNNIKDIQNLEQSDWIDLNNTILLMEEDLSNNKTLNFELNLNLLNLLCEKVNNNLHKIINELAKCSPEYIAENFDNTLSYLKVVDLIIKKRISSMSSESLNCLADVIVTFKSVLKNKDIMTRLQINSIQELLLSLEFVSMKVDLFMHLIDDITSNPSGYSKLQLSRIKHAIAYFMIENGDRFEILLSDYIEQKKFIKIGSVDLFLNQYEDCVNQYDLTRYRTQIATCLTNNIQAVCDEVLELDIKKQLSILNKYLFMLTDYIKCKEKLDNTDAVLLMKIIKHIEEYYITHKDNQDLVRVYDKSFKSLMLNFKAKFDLSYYLGYGDYFDISQNLICSDYTTDRLYLMLKDMYESLIENALLLNKYQDQVIDILNKVTKIIELRTLETGKKISGSDALWHVENLIESKKLYSLNKNFNQLNRLVTKIYKGVDLLNLAEKFVSIQDIDLVKQERCFTILCKAYEYQSATIPIKQKEKIDDLFNTILNSENFGMQNMVLKMRDKNAKSEDPDLLLNKKSLNNNKKQYIKKFLSLASNKHEKQEPTINNVATTLFGGHEKSKSFKSNDIK